MNVVKSSFIWNVFSAVDALAAFLSRDEHKGLQGDQLALAEFLQRGAVNRRPLLPVPFVLAPEIDCRVLFDLPLQADQITNGNLLRHTRRTEIVLGTVLGSFGPGPGAGQPALRIDRRLGGRRRRRGSWVQTPGFGFGGV